MFEKLFSRFASPRRLREAGILGMNRRNYNVIAKNNRRRLYPLVDDKVQTKMLANKIGINTPGLIGVIEYQHEVKNILNIVKNYKEFVVKPAHGSGGKGVLVIKDYTEDAFTKSATTSCISMFPTCSAAYTVWAANMTLPSLKNWFTSAIFSINTVIRAFLTCGLSFTKAIRQWQ